MSDSNNIVVHIFLSDVIRKIVSLYFILYLDYCESISCDNGGTCISMESDYICQCQRGYGGALCNRDVIISKDTVMVMETCSAYMYLKSTVLNITRKQEF